ncbi:MAG: hypothetical protein CMD19_05115 [Flavobacteriales bacterium]|nr:hypothetical protein [Flavobacteriales bacterium]|tara:strand:+ start:5401 stop:5817 length:417 start_codon:yes stop_codon:yes gene_type:complete
MGRRLLLFGFGALISIFFLSLGPQNRLKDTFYAYVDYFNVDKRVISHLINDSTTFTAKSECQLVYYNITKDDLLSVLDGGEVNFDLSDEDGEPCQHFVIENIVNGNKLLVEFELCYYNNKSVKVLSFTNNNEEEVCKF